MDNVKQYYCDYYSLHGETNGDSQSRWNYDRHGDDWECQGNEQSPIDIIEKDAAPSVTEYLKVWWASVPIQTKVINNGHTLIVQASVSRLVGTSHDDKRHNALYDAIQFHFHHPSEHKINGRSFPLEMHIVHAITEDHFQPDTPRRNIANLSILFEVDDHSPPNPLIECLQLDSIGTEITINMYDMLGFIQHPEFFGYRGSLTTPPCAEVVSWFVLKEPLTITSKQLEHFKLGIKGNNRNCQPLRGRTVYRGNCTPMFSSKNEHFAAASEKKHESLSFGHIAVAKALHQESSSELLVIGFEDFKAAGHFPCFPESKPLLRPLSSLDTSGALNIYISHTWFEEKNHDRDPDNAYNEKYRLCVDAAEKLMAIAHVDSSYLWMDSMCSTMNDLSPLHLKHLWAVMEFCDCMLTPIISHGEPEFIAFTGPLSYFSDYKSHLWNGSERAYVNRAMSRLEMFFAAAVPLTPTQSAKSEKFKAGIGMALKEGRRAHVLYGAKEKRERANPHFLPPLQHSYLESLNPAAGYVHDASQLVLVKEILATMEPYIKIPQSTFNGHHVWKSSVGDRKGLRVYRNGDVYEGEHLYGHRHGKGFYSYAEGETYEGDWKDGMTHGVGKICFADGSVYFGQIKFDVFDGRGRMEFANGDKYEGM